MAEKLWFVYESGFPIYVYQSKTDAQRAVKEMEIDSDYEDLSMESVLLDDLEEFQDDYQDEFELAMDEGLI